MRKREDHRKPWQDKAAAHIAARIIRGEMYISRRLQKLEQRLTVRQKKAGLFIFCLVCSVYLLYLLGNALFFERQPHFHDFLPGQDMSSPPADSGGFPDGPAKHFFHYKKNRL